MQNSHLRWVPHELISDLRRCRLEIYGRLLPILEATELESFRILVAGKESWFVLEDQHSIKWSLARDEVPTKVSHNRYKRVMLTMI
jgi:hypothetical protein